MAGDASDNPFDVTLPLETIDLGATLGPPHDVVVTDGLPVVTPTRADVDAMLGGRRREAIAGVLAPMMGEATLERVAALAVLAGCPPPTFPMLVAAVKAVAEDPFNLLAVQTTTGNVAVAVILSGGAATAAGFHAGSNGLGPGPRSNVTLGRALRFVLMNVGGATPGLLDVATMGWPGKLSFCIVEHAAASPWPAFHVDRGLPEHAAVVTTVATYGFMEMADAVSTSADALLENLSTMMAAGFAGGSMGTQAVVLLTPQHAHTLAGSGLDRRRTQAFLYERVMRAATHADGFAGKPISVASTADDVLLVVTGGNGGKSAFVPVWSSSRAVSVAVE